MHILTGSRAGQTVSLRQDSYVIGSDEGASITCLDPEVEWSHARIYHDRARFWVEDLQSRSGVLVNERPVLHKSLKDGDRIRIGQVTFGFALNGAGAAGAAAGSAAEQAPAETLTQAQADADALSEAATQHAQAHAQAHGRPIADAEPAAAARGSAGAGAPVPPLAPIALTPVDEPLDEQLDEAHFLLDSAPDLDAPAAAAGLAAPEPLSAGDAPRTSSIDELMAAMEHGDSDAAERYAAGTLTSNGAPDAGTLGATAAAIASGDVQALRGELERQQEENQDLKARLALLESELKKKRTGLSLATESFVEQLERAKERIQTFAKKHAESEDRARSQADEIERLRAEKAAVEREAQARVDELVDKLEAVRRDFEEMERLLRSKGQAYAKTLTEARDVARAAFASASASAGSSALRQDGGAAAAGLRTSDDGGDDGGGGGGASGSGGGSHGGGVGSGGAGRRRPSRPSGLTPTPVAVEIDLDDDGAGGAGGAAGAASDADGGRAASGERAAGRLELDPVGGSGGRTARGGLGRSARMRVATVAFFVLLFCCAFMLVFLVHKGRSGRAAQASAPPARAAGDEGRDARGRGQSFPAAEELAVRGPERAPAARDRRPAPRPEAAPAAAAAPSDEAKPARADAEQGELAAAAGDDLLQPLRDAIRARDEARIAAEEQALIDKGSGNLEVLEKAEAEEKQFQVKVSLQYVIRMLKGEGGAQSIVDSMRQTTDAGEKMRLAFMLLKLGEKDLPLIEQVLQGEQDPMIRKYLIRALGEMDAAGGMTTLERIARGSQERSERVEAIRSIEKLNPPGVASLLADLSRAEEGHDAQIRAIAIRALANIGESDQGGFFAEVLNDERTNNRAEAAKFYTRVGTAADLPTLEGALQRERVYYIRQKLEKAIEQIKARDNVQ